MRDSRDKSSDNADLRRRAEEQWGRQQAPSSRQPTDQELRRSVHELEVHQIELEMQNEKLRASEGELEIARSQYFALHDLAPVGYVSLNPAGLILKANLTAATLLGVERDTLIGKPLSGFVSPPDGDTLFLHYEKAVSTRARQLCEITVVRPDGTRLCARLDTDTVAADDGCGHQCLMALTDITERKRAEESLRASNEELEGFNRAMVDRGLRMVKLKRQVNELCVQAGRPPHIRWPSKRSRGDFAAERRPPCRRPGTGLFLP